MHATHSWPSSVLPKGESGRTIGLLNMRSKRFWRRGSSKVFPSGIETVRILPSAVATHCLCCMAWIGSGGREGDGGGDGGEGCDGGEGGGGGHF